MELGGEGRAVDENFSFRADEQRVTGQAEDGELGGVVGDDGENNVGRGGDGGEGGGVFRADFPGERGGGRGVGVVDGGDGVAAVLEATGHVGAHAADSDEGDFFSSSHGEV